MLKSIVLIVSIIMPRDIPDIQHISKMESLDACFEAAKEYMEKDISEEVRNYGGIGLGAMCAYQELPSTKN